MGTRTFTVTGWKAIAVLLVVGGIIGFRMLSQARSLETEASDVVRSHLAVEYQREYMASMPTDSVATQTDAEEILRRADVRVERITARGRGDDVVVRVDVTVAGASPPDGRARRYFRMTYSVVTGWRIARETTALAYYLRF